MSEGTVLERWTSRKFWAAMVWQGVITWMRVQGHLPPEMYVSLTWVILGGYFVGNVAQSVLGSKQSGSAQ